MSQIKFGTDGWRAIIAKDYTVDNVIRVATATAMFVISKGGDSVDMTGEKHGSEAVHAPAPAAAAPAEAPAAPAAAPAAPAAKP